MPRLRVFVIIDRLIRLGRGRCVPALWDDATGRGDLPLATFHMPDEREPFLGKSLQYMQENIRRAGPAATAGYTLIGAILLLGGAGYLIDRWQDTSPWFMLAGLLVGMVVGFYELAKTVWKR